MGLPGGLATTSLPYWPTTRIDRPSGVVTALIVSDTAAAPGLCSVATCCGWALSWTSTTATPFWGAGGVYICGAMPPPGPATYAQLPAQAMLALPVAGRPPGSRVACPTRASPQLYPFSARRES